MSGLIDLQVDQERDKERERLSVLEWKKRQIRCESGIIALCLYVCVRIRSVQTWQVLIIIVKLIIPDFSLLRFLFGYMSRME